MTKSAEMAELIVNLLQDHYSRLSNQKHMNSIYSAFADHWGAEVEGNSVLLEIGEDSYRFTVEHE